MKELNLIPIGYVKSKDGSFSIELKKEYIPALKEVDSFSHINVLWWFNDFEGEEYRSILETNSPYKNSPETMGIFATRSPIRPNPIALTACQIIDMDIANGRIYLGYIDANDGSPVLDIKPYTPSFDIVSEFETPKWCANWPKNMEDSAEFDWQSVFNF